MTSERRPGRPPLADDEPTVRVVVRMPESQRARLADAAEVRGEKAADFVRRAVAAALDAAE